MLQLSDFFLFPLYYKSKKEKSFLQNITKQSQYWIRFNRKAILSIFFSRKFNRKILRLNLRLFSIAESTIFIQFMLLLIRDLLKELSHNGVMNKEKTLDEKLFGLLKENGKQSAAELAEIVGSSPRTVQRALKRLMDDGKIEHVGSNRFGHYVIKQDL